MRNLGAVVNRTEVGRLRKPGWEKDSPSPFRDQRRNVKSIGPNDTPFNELIKTIGQAARREEQLEQRTTKQFFNLIKEIFFQAENQKEKFLFYFN